MKINVATKLLDMDGKEIPASAEPDAEPVTLCKIAVEALMGIYKDEPDLSGEEKVKRFKLAMKLRDGDEPDLEVEELALIKKLIGKAFPSPLVVARCFDILDGHAPAAA